MKRAFTFIGVYIFTLLFVTVLVSAVLLLSPDAPNVSEYTGAFERIADIFVFSFFSLLPLAGVFSLLAVVLTAVKRGRTTILEFLTYIFLSCIAWLIIIPVSFLYNPASNVCFMITGRNVSPAQIFFKTGFLHTALSGYEGVYLNPPPVLIKSVSALIHVGNMLQSAVESGRLSYLMSASAGITFISLYAFHAFSQWKFMNAFLITILWLGVSALNMYIYIPPLKDLFTHQWMPLIVNSSVSILFCIPPLISAIAHRNTEAEY